MSSNATNGKSRSPRRPEGSEEPPAKVRGIEDGFESMWKDKFEAKLDSFKEDVKGAVKNLVVGEIQALETRMDARFEEARYEAVCAREETASVKASVERIEQALTARTQPPSYADAVGIGSRGSNMGNGNLPPPAPFPPAFPASFPRAPQGLLSPETLNQ